jgi:sugar lactone lactonase YvrE
LFKLVNGAPVSVLRRDGRQLQYLTSEGKNLLIGFRCPTSACFRGEMVYLDVNGKQTDVPNDCFSLPNYAIEDEKGRVWFGDVESFRRLNSLSDRNCSTLVFNSPYSEKVREIAIYDNQIWTAAGGVDQRFSYTFTSDGFASYIDGKWTIYNLFNQPVMRGVDPKDGDDDVRDVITIAVNPSNGKVYAGSFLEGLVEKDGDKYTLYNDKNSSLNNTVGDAQRTRVSGLAFDKNNNLWVANHLADRPISVFKTDGKWQSFKPSCFETALHQLAIDRNGYKWFASSSNANGLIVFDEGKLDNPNDDRCRIFNQSNSKLTTNRVNCVQADIDGDVWVGTAEGIIIFECSNPFENSCIGSARAVSENGFLGLLLKTEDIQTIAVDGANRKWVGTKNGVFLLSANGEQQLASFNEKNSPLLSNIITDITVNPSNGEVFIGTQSGINVYQGDATVGDRYNAAAIEVYPNPVRPGYTGSIAMRGLARDAIVKITDVSGQLVFETKALGGQAIWDGRDYQGRKVHSGVYLVLAASNPRDAGFGKPSTAIGKIVFIDQE